MTVCNVIKYNVNLMAFKTQAIKYHTNLVNPFEKSVARLLDLAPLSETASLTSSTPSWDSELQQKQWLSLRFYIPVGRVTIPGDCQYIQRQIHVRRERRMEGGLNGCLIAVNLRYLSLQPAQLPAQGSEAALPGVIPQPLAGERLNWRRVKNTLCRKNIKPFFAQERWGMLSRKQQVIRK